MTGDDDLLDIPDFLRNPRYLAAEKVKQMEAEACKFYRDAFCAKSARIVNPREGRKFAITGVVEIESGDDRGTIFVAAVKEIKGDRCKRR